MTQSVSALTDPTATRWLTETETARRLGMSVKWLQKMRVSGGGIRFAKFGNAVRYSVADIEDFESSALRTSTSDLGMLAR